MELEDHQVRPGEFGPEADRARGDAGPVPLPGLGPARRGQRGWLRDGRPLLPAGEWGMCPVPGKIHTLRRKPG